MQGEHITVHTAWCVFFLHFIYLLVSVLFPKRCASRWVGEGWWGSVVLMLVKMFPVVLFVLIRLLNGILCVSLFVLQWGSDIKRPKEEKKVRNWWSRAVWELSIASHFQGTSQMAVISLVVRWKVNKVSAESDWSLSAPGRRKIWVECNQDSAAARLRIFRLCSCEKHGSPRLKEILLLIMCWRPWMPWCGKLCILWWMFHTSPPSINGCSAKCNFTFAQSHFLPYEQAKCRALLIINPISCWDTFVFICDWWMC